MIANSICIYQMYRASEYDVMALSSSDECFLAINLHSFLSK